MDTNMIMNTNTNERKRKDKNILKRGMTLVELMLVLVVLGLLAGLTAPRYLNFGENAKKRTRAANISAVNDTLDIFQTAGGTLSTTTVTGSETLDGSIDVSNADTIVTALTTGDGVWAGGQSHALKIAPVWGSAGAPAVTNGRLVQDGK
jgi:prepilin-type N-terminal cleavage/methylation domain-containing protein